MDDFDKQKLSKEENFLIAPCGIFCGACHVFLGKSKTMASELHRVLDGFNLADVGPIFLNVEPEKIVGFMDVLKKIGDSKQCLGCLAGGGNPVCPMKTCASERGYLTCAECDKLPCYLYEEEKDDGPMGKTTIMELICKRYQNWNIENLKRVKEVGYRQFIDEMNEKVSDGFLTSDVISKEMCMTDFFKKMKEEG